MIKNLLPIIIRICFYLNVVDLQITILKIGEIILVAKENGLIPDCINPYWVIGKKNPSALLSGFFYFPNTSSAIFTLALASLA